MIFYIYKIQIADFIYIGATTDYTKRCKKHKYNKYLKNRVLYQKIEEAGGMKPIFMSLVETLDCEKAEARIREQYYIDHFKANMNMINSHLTEEQKIEQRRKDNELYRQRHAEEIIERQRNHREQHREQYNEYMRNWSKENRQRKNDAQNRYRLAKKQKELAEKQQSETTSIIDESQPQINLGQNS